MKLASELRKSLSEAGVPDSQIEDIVKGRIEAGTVEDDGAPTDIGLGVDELEAAIGDLEKSLGAGEGEGGLNKGHGGLDLDELDSDGLDPADVIDVLAKGSDAIVGEVHAALHRGDRVTLMLAKSVAAQGRALERAGTQLDAIFKAMEQPLPQRGFTGLQALPPPGETPAAGAAAGENTSACLMAKALTRMRLPGTDDLTKGRLADAVAQLESGVDPARVERELGTYGLSLSA